MNKGQFLNKIEGYAKEYIKICSESVNRNKHMNNYKGDVIDQDLIDAIIVDFTNYIGSEEGLDYGLYVYYLYEKNKRDKYNEQI